MHIMGPGAGQQYILSPLYKWHRNHSTVHYTSFLQAMSTKHTTSIYILAAQNTTSLSASCGQSSKLLFFSHQEETLEKKVQKEEYSTT